jgi:undecaprenyl-diphosphatase
MEDFFKTVLLGIIEGITEFLPISSTGHLLIAEKLGLGARSEVFNIVIQAGAVCAVVVIYWKRLLELLTHWNDQENREYLIKLAVAFGVTGFLGFIVSKKGWRLPEDLRPVAWALIIGGFAIFLVEYLLKSRKDSKEKLTWPMVIAVGIAQVVAGVFPGTSRSAASILAAMLFGVTRPIATEFSFLVGIPTMFAASANSLWKFRHDPAVLKKQHMK